MDKTKAKALVGFKEALEMLANNELAEICPETVKTIIKALQPKEPDECPRGDNCDLTVAYMCGQENEAKRRRKEPEWLDIASAPRDGTRIDLFFPETGRLCGCEYDKQYGFVLVHGHPQTMTVFTTRPTHWMHLLTPPTNEEG